MKRIILIILLFLMVSSIGCNRSEVQQIGSIQSRLDACISSHAAKRGFNGSVLVAREGGVLLEKGYGMADFEKQVENSPDTIFRLASVTKQFTSMCIMILKEGELLDVNDPISMYISDYPKGDTITIYNLLTQTSGIAEHTNLQLFRNADYYYSPEDLIALFKDKPLKFQPGSQFQYSNSNYVLLGYIIEKVSGMKYGDFVDKYIFEPLGMDASGYDDGRLPAENRAVGYKRIKPFALPADYIDMSIPYAAGGICSTVGDLYKWDRALYTEKLVNKETMGEVFTPYKGNYACGWFVDNIKGKEKEHKTMFHGGGIHGFSTMIVRTMDEDVSIIILSNRENRDLIPMVKDIFSILETME